MLPVAYHSLKAEDPLVLVLLCGSERRGRGRGLDLL